MRLLPYALDNNGLVQFKLIKSYYRVYRLWYRNGKCISLDSHPIEYFIRFEKEKDIVLQALNYD